MFLAHRRWALAITIAGVALLPACGGGAKTAGAPVRSAITPPTSEITTVAAGPGDPTVDGAASATAALAGGARNSHDIVVPAGITATVTVTPSAREDVILKYEGLEFDDALFGQPEAVQITGPKHLTMSVYSTFNHEPGTYTISVTS